MKHEKIMLAFLLIAMVVNVPAIKAQLPLLEKTTIDGLCAGAISVVDFNADGHVDIIFSGKKVTDLASNYNSTYVYRGNGDGTFTLVEGDSDDGPVTYQNPVSEKELPDPTVIRGLDGRFYLYATESSSRNMPIMASKNLIDWEMITTVFTNETRPSFLSGGDLWAPDINYINGQYVMYYSLSNWGEEWANGIGVATSSQPYTRFTDRGKLFTSSEIGVQNSIDPFYIEDNGKKYLFWGSFRGIYAIELSADGLSVKQDAEKVRVAGTAYEGVYIHKRGQYYYFFASIGSCCEGVNSTYQLVVGRGESLLGPYFSRKGTNMLNNGWHTVIGTNSTFVGNGHCSQIVQDDAGNDWILYHGFKTTDTNGRQLMLDRIQWDVEGWPYVEGGSPSVTSSGPVFNK